MRIFLAEDEPLAAQKLQLFLQKLGERPEDITLFNNGADLVRTLRNEPHPDLLFLDIQMPGLTGIEVLRELQNTDNESDAMKIIITSAFDHYAIDGFNFGVSDYLLKPYTLDRLRQALAKVRPEPKISIRCEGRTERIRISDIVCLESNKDYTCFTLEDGRSLMTLGTLSGFEQQLPVTLFTRVQRSYIVGLKHIQSYNSQSVTLSTGTVVPIGKTYKESFEQAISSVS